jgi:thiamine biosynthesis lipoprotein
MISAVSLYPKILIVCGLLLAGCLRFEGKEELKELKGEIFGSYYLIKYRGPLSVKDLEGELQVFFKSFNDEFSTYQSNSVISQFNKSPKDTPIKVSNRFIEMLKLAQKFHQETEGAFEPTLGPVIKAWGFGGGKIKKSEGEIREAHKVVGFHHIKWDEKNRTIWKDLDGVELDVNAFAPGWAADLIGEMLESKSVQHFMVDISGEILFKGTKSSELEWIGAIERPSQKHGESVHLAFKSRDMAIATSGNYRQFFNENGQRKSHIIDPRTGQPVVHSISSASVIAKSAASADAWGTALMVLGREGVAKAEKHGIKVLLLEAEGPEQFKEIVSDSMNKFIEGHRL